MKSEMCHCGKPLHYKDDKLRQLVEDFIDLSGEHMIVTVRNRSWKVPRHYVALHGVKAYEIERLGFEEVRHE